jgi:hypothetical protein
MELIDLYGPDATSRRRNLDRERGLLVGSTCPCCGASSWPGRVICHRCGKDMTLDVELPATGTLLSYTRVWVARPGLPSPYTLGQIEIADAVFFAHVRGLADDAKVPTPVQVVISPTPSDAIAFWFAPVDSRCIR